MFYENWMSYIKDDAKLTNIAIPGSHNAGTRGMVALARCQNGTLPEQYCYGVRKFGIRIKAGRNGKLYIAHGLAKGRRSLPRAGQHSRQIRRLHDPRYPHLPRPGHRPLPF